jgi:hypothetical protein
MKRSIICNYDQTVIVIKQTTQIYHVTHEDNKKFIQNFGQNTSRAQTTLNDYD